MARPTRSVRSADPRPAGLQVALERIGDRWSLLVVDALLAGSQRFGDLQGSVAGIAPNILSRRLKQLEADGVVVARRYCDRPPRYDYELSARGRELADALRLLEHWGAGTSSEAADVEPVRHDACGTPAEVRWWCPTCAHTLDDEERDGLHRV